MECSHSINVIQYIGWINHRRYMSPPTAATHMLDCHWCEWGAVNYGDVITGVTARSLQVIPGSLTTTVVTYSKIISHSILEYTNVCSTWYAIMYQTITSGSKRFTRHYTKHLPWAVARPWQLRTFQTSHCCHITLYCHHWWYPTMHGGEHYSVTNMSCYHHEL